MLNFRYGRVEAIYFYFKLLLDTTNHIEPIYMYFISYICKCPSNFHCEIAGREMNFGVCNACLCVNFSLRNENWPDLGGNSFEFFGASSEISVHDFMILH